MEKSTLSKYGRSKEKRSDAKLVVLTLMVNEQGCIKFAQFLEANSSDSEVKNKS